MFTAFRRPASKEGRAAAHKKRPARAHLVERELALEVDQQPPEGEEVVEAVACLKERVQLRVQHLRE
jgi:hypothetical protein